MCSLHLLIDVTADGIEEYGEKLYYYICMFLKKTGCDGMGMCCKKKTLTG